MVPAAKKRLFGTFTQAGRRKNNPRLAPRQAPNETRTKPEQVPNKFRTSPAAKIAEKQENKQNPNETRTSPEQVPNKSGALKHCKQTIHQVLLARDTGFAQKCLSEGFWISHERTCAEGICLLSKNVQKSCRRCVSKKNAGKC